MPKVKKVNLSEMAADFVRQEIMDGRLKQREKIVEKEIANQLGISRGPVREALKQLMYEGFVDYEVNKGCTVTLLSPRDAYEVFYMRGSLEKLALERSGGQLLIDNLLLMEESLEGMKLAYEKDDMARLVACDNIFHKQIMLSGQMERLTKMWESMSGLNGAMFLTVKSANEIEAEEQISTSMGMTDSHRLTAYEAHVVLLNTLKQGDLERSNQAIDDHYLTTGERIYRIGVKLENKALFLR